jgi:hypothetical protein
VESILKGVVGVIRDHVKIPLQKRMEELEKLLKGSATRAEVEEIHKLNARVEPLEAMASRLSATEACVGALSMMGIDQLECGDR